MLSLSKHEGGAMTLNGKKAGLIVIAVLALAGVGWFARPLFNPPPAPKPLFADWAAMIVAGDSHAHSGADSMVFDNARRDLAQAFVGMGFQPANIAQFSAIAQKFPHETVKPAAEDPITTGLAAVTQRARAGCLIYLTSHGAEDGIVIGDRIVDPAPIADLIGQECGTRPTVVIVSACFSGIFVPALEGPHRIVFTAARSDRTSFGCGEEDRYTFFDACVLGTIGKVASFPALAERTRNCVTAREAQMNAEYRKAHEEPDLPSEPQFVMDPALAGLRWR
jgi:hypothetical protein